MRQILGRFTGGLKTIPLGSRLYDNYGSFFRYMSLLLHNLGAVWVSTPWKPALCDNNVCVVTNSSDDISVTSASVTDRSTPSPAHLLRHDIPSSSDGHQVYTEDYFTNADKDNEYIYVTYPPDLKRRLLERYLKNVGIRCLKEYTLLQKFIFTLRDTAHTQFHWDLQLDVTRKVNTKLICQHKWQETSNCHLFYNTPTNLNTKHFTTLFNSYSLCNLNRKTSFYIYINSPRKTTPSSCINEKK